MTERDKVDVGHSDAMIMLPPAPVMLLAVGAEETNVATMSMFNVFSAQPIVMGVGVTTARYSYKLLRGSPDFSLNVPGVDLVETVKRCGTTSGKDIFKFEECGLTPVPGKRIGSPKVGECLLNLEIRKKEEMSIGDHTWFLGELVHADAVPDYDRGMALTYWGGEFRRVGEVVADMFTR